MISTIVIIIIIIYLILIGSLIYGFDQVDEFKLQDLKPKTSFTVVIPFRNEAHNLSDLLDSIYKLNYPKSLYEILFIDDQSEDASVVVIEDFMTIHNDFDKLSQNKRIQYKTIENIKTSYAPKKDAITTAINIAKHEWVITTDADCILPKYWLDSFDELIQTHNPNCIAAPVNYISSNSFFNRFQTLDFLSLQGATIGGFGLKSPFLCNGANFGYRTSIFKSLNGFNGNDEIASGDDIFLLEKLKQLNLNKVDYLKTSKAIVHTKPVENIRLLIQQRLRWASKTSKNPNQFSKLIGIVIAIANLTCISLIPLLLFDKINPRIALAVFVIKFAIDFLLLFKTTRFFRQENILFSFISSSVIYPFFSIYIVILSLIKPYTWKGRTFKF